MSRPNRNREDQARHKKRMREEGFVRVCLWAHPDLKAEIARQRRWGECAGRCLERLLLGAARPRPKFERDTPPALAGPTEESP